MASVRKRRKVAKDGVALYWVVDYSVKREERGAAVKRLSELGGVE